MENTIEKLGSRYNIGTKVAAAASVLALSVPGAARFAIPESNKPYDEVVLMGDSIASGYGNRPYEPGTDQPADISAGITANHCSRSIKYNPASLLSIDPTNFACQGASANNIYIEAGRQGAPGEPMYNEPITQMQMLENLVSNGSNPDVIIVSAGVNEKSFAEIINKCLGNMSCMIGPDLESSLRNTFMSEPFRKKLERMYKRILEISPESKLVVLGYVSPVGEDFPWENLPNIAGLSDIGSIVKSINRAINDINFTQEITINKIDDERITFVKPSQISSVWEQVLSGQNFILNIHSFTFGHPNAKGQLQISQAIKKALFSKYGSPLPAEPTPLWPEGMAGYLPTQPKSLVRKNGSVWKNYLARRQSKKPR